MANGTKIQVKMPNTPIGSVLATLVGLGVPVASFVTPEVLQKIPVYGWYTLMIIAAGSFGLKIVEAWRMNDPKHNTAQ